MPYLTKSLFQIGYECPTKLYYRVHSEKYANTKMEDPFLEALANGGFQIGALARAYYPEGILVNEETNEDAITKTKTLLEQENCTLFEAAIHSGPFLIRVDILIKKRNKFELIEVKAKSFHPDSDSFLTNKGKISSNWKPYLVDVAFQEMVFTQAFPGVTLDCFLMLADKSKTATVDGLNQKFRIIKEKGRFRVKTPEFLTVEELGEKILRKEPINQEIAILQEEQFEFGEEVYTLSSFADRMASDIKNNYKRYIGIGKHCNKCEFQTDDKQFLSGFKECWKDQTGLTDQQLQHPLLFELWRGNLGSKDIISLLINRRDYFLYDYQESDYAPKIIKPSNGYSPTERRTLQIQTSLAADNTPCYNKEYLIEAFGAFTYPLHFIDFETTALAIPMYAGRKPYEQIAFQFSHHKVDAEGKISHQTQWLNDQVGVFPNFEFIRELKKALETDHGTILRYHNHENTILNVILSQLLESNEIDKNELCDFIRSITHSKAENQIGERDMVDLYQLVIGGFYHSSMKGSNSIKSVLPAVIESSDFLKNKYSTACYGTEAIPSLNLKNHTWLLKDDAGKWINPYKTLPAVFDEANSEQLDALCEENGEELRDGGAAMMAYAKMQFSEMHPDERNFYHNALLKYCELDTLAMVMIYEGWKDYLIHN
jgi:hypothetical protein